MKQTMNVAASFWVDAPETARESRSGLPGLGGRPAMHPAWSGQPFETNSGVPGNEVPSQSNEFIQHVARMTKGS